MCWVCYLGYLVVHYLISFCLTVPKQLHQLNSNLEDTTPSKLLNGLSWNFVGMIFRIFFVPYLLIFCVTALIRPHRLSCAIKLNWLNSKFVIATTSQPYNRFSLNFRVFYLVCLIVPYLFSYCKTAPKQLNKSNSNLLQLLLLNCSTKWADNFRVY